jgi:hypothetical protein
MRRPPFLLNAAADLSYRQRCRIFCIRAWRPLTAFREYDTTLTNNLGKPLHLRVDIGSDELDLSSYHFKYLMIRPVFFQIGASLPEAV